MKKVILVILVLVTIAYFWFLWVTQGGEQMLMKNWLEVMICESLLLEVAYLTKSVLKKPKNKVP